MRLPELRVRLFNGGITNDPRDPRPNVFRMLTNFDNQTDPARLVPYYDSEDGDDAASTSQKRNFCIGYKTAGTDEWVVFSLGVKSGAATAEVLYKSLTTGAAQDLDDNDWDSTAIANNQSASGAVNDELFHYYHKVGKVYGARASQHIWAFTPDGSTAWADSAYDYGSTFTYLSDAITHSQDDIMYFGIDNKIIKNDNGTFSVALTLPSEFHVNSVCEHGRYLAIGVAANSGSQNSRVFLWDRDSSLVTVDVNTDAGEGVIKVLEHLNGYLVSISLVGGDSTQVKDRIVFRYYNGNGFEHIKTIEGTTSTQLLISKQKVRDRIHFMMQATINGAVREGVWSIGISAGQWTVIHERTPNNDTALSSGVLKNFIYVGHYLFQAYVSSGTYAVKKTNDQASYTATAIAETVKYNWGESSQTKKLVGLNITTDALPSGGQLVLKYRKDEETSFTTIFTSSTANSISYEAINITSTGVNLPEFKEIEFRIESTGGAVVTGLNVTADLIGKTAYART